MYHTITISVNYKNNITNVADTFTNGTLVVYGLVIYTYSDIESPADIVDAFTTL